MKKNKHFLLTVAAILFSISVSAHDFVVNRIYYNITSEADKTVAVTYRGYDYDLYSNEYSGSVSIPESVTNNGTTYSVTSIDYRAFGYCSGLTSIEIPNSVTSIGIYAFEYCSGLTSVTIPNSVTSIRYGAFSFCSGLTSVTIPNSVTSIGNWTFSGCSGLTSVTIPNSVTSIGYEAFWGCSGLTSVTIPNSVTSIGERAFWGCSGLTSVTILSSVTSIGDDAFRGTPWYNAKPNGLVYINNVLYKYKGTMPSGTTIEIKEGTISISSFAFRDCSGLTSVTIPNSVTSIGSYAFSGCSPKSLTIGSGVLSIGSDQCKPVKTIWLTNTPPSGYKNLQGNINYVANDQYSGLSNVWVYPYLSSMFETDGVKYVPVSPAERTCDAIDCSYDSTVVDINIGETVSFKGVEMKVQNVMPYTVYKQTSVKTLSVSHAGDIGNYAFYGCTGITNATISNEGNIGESAFEGAMTSSNAVLKVSNKGYIYPKAFCGCTGITDATISNEGNIGESAFEGAMTSSNAVLKVSNKGNISNKAFYGCTGITDATISNDGNIGESAFYGCTALKTANVEIGETIQTEEGPITFADWVSTNKSHNSSSSEIYTFTISKNAVLSFNWKVSSESGYDKLIVTLDGTTILVKSGSYNGTYSGKVGQGSHTLVVKYTKDEYQSSGADKAEVYGIMVGNGTIGVISSEAFRGCTALETLTLGENVASIGGSAFRDCSKLLAVTIPNKTTSLGTYSFAGCSLLKQLDLGNGVQSIGEYSFNGCSALPSIDIPASVTSVGDYTFKGCTSIADVVIKDRTTDLSLGSNGSSPLFADCPLDSVYIGGNISYKTSSSYGYSPFYRNTSLRSVVITDKEEEISDNEFYGCTNLKNVSIGSNVKKIGNWAFSGCSNLDYFSFGKSVESIGEEAFSDCVNMTQLISHAVTPPTCGTQALDDINKWNCILKIPEGTNSAYMAANQWKEFFFIENVPNAINGVVMDGENADKNAPVYNMHGVRMQNTDNLPAGIYIKNGKKYLVR